MYTGGYQRRHRSLKRWLCWAPGARLTLKDLGPLRYPRSAADCTPGSATPSAANGHPPRAVRPATRRQAGFRARM